jgi:hypothetical protein
MLEKHLHPHRGWTLIRDGGVLTPEESAHLECCHSCNEWMVSFVSLARKAGFHISFVIPPYNLAQRLHAA